MNTLIGFKSLLKQEKSHLLFDDKNIDFGLTQWQRKEVLSLWNQGKSVIYITKIVKRNQHEVFLTLYEYWMGGEIDDIEKAFSNGAKLMIPPGKGKVEK